MRVGRIVVIAAVVPGALAVPLAGCAALLGVGDLERVDCVGEACGADGATDGTARVEAADPDSGRDGGAADATVDASSDATSDVTGPRDARADVVARDAPSDGAPTVVRCALDNCPVPQEECCLSSNPSCQAAGAGGCGNGLLVPCDDKLDCPGADVCCVSLNGQGNPTGVACAASCSGVVLCAPDAGQCSGGGTCAPSSKLAGYFHCQ